VVFERFTDRARRAVVLAQEEARLLDHNYVGTEHLLLGLIHEREGVAAQALESLEVSLDAVRAEVQEIIGRGAEMPSGHIPFTPRAKKVLELSLREALQLGHNYIGTEHILLGLVREGEGVAAQVLARLGADLSLVRQHVIQALSGYEPRATTSTPRDRPRRGIVRASCAFCGTSSPECGTLFTGVRDMLICAQCLLRGAEAASQRSTFGTRTVELSAVHRPRRTIEELADQYEATGTPPEDEARARSEIEHAFTHMVERDEDGRSLRNVEGGEQLGDCADQVAARWIEIGDRSSHHVDHIKFLNSTEAVVWWTTQIGSQPLGGVFDRREGRAVFVVDTWKVSRTTLCALFEIAGVDCPPLSG
jgi:Clp amino terminal domain, pathogenicity island component